MLTRYNLQKNSLLFIYKWFLVAYLGYNLHKKKRRFILSSILIDEDFKNISFVILETVMLKHILLILTFNLFYEFSQVN